MQDATFKLCIFGDGGVGKTTLINKYLTGIFIGDTHITIGVDFHMKIVKLGGITVKLQIWDFAGEERFRFFLPNYMRGASGGIFMYDITRQSSLYHLDDWLKILVKDNIKVQDTIPILLVGGKADLEDARTVDSEFAYNLTKANNLNGFIECSAKTGQNVELIFELIARLMIKKAEFLELSENFDNIKISY